MRAQGLAWTKDELEEMEAIFSCKLRHIDKEVRPMKNGRAAKTNDEKKN